MAYELQTSLEFNRDRILKNQFDQVVKGRLQIIAGQKNNPLQKEKINLIFLLDSSSSMTTNYYNTGKNKQTAVFEALNQLVDIIDNRDTVSIISFNSQAIVHADHLPGSAKSGLKQALQNYLTDSGATNFEAAMNMAESVIKKNGENYKIIFLTDGQSVTGNDKKAFSICQTMANNGITTDAMGIGEDFEFEFMKKFSDYSGSKTENIIQSTQAVQVFKNIYANTTNVFLKKVFINIHLADNVRDVHFYMHEPEQKNLYEFISKNNDGTTIQINSGDIEQQAFKEYLFDFTIDTPDIPSMKIGSSIVHFDCPSENISNQEQQQQLYLNFSDNIDEEINDHSIETAFKDIEILEIQNDLFKLIEQNNYTEAAVKLEEMANIAERIGDYDKAETFREKKNEIMRGNKLTQADLNILSYTSSRSSVQSIRIQSEKKKKKESIA